MFKRYAFITNSSSTGFVAWGVLVDKATYDGLDKLEIMCNTTEGNLFKESRGGGLFFVGHTDSFEECYNYTIDGNTRILSQELIREDDQWRAKTVTDMTWHVNAPRDGATYSAWYRELQAALNERNACILVGPGWFYISYE